MVMVVVIGLSYGDVYAVEKMVGLWLVRVYVNVVLGMNFGLE